MFSQSTRVCLRALAQLVEHKPGTVVQSSDIANKVGVSSTYVTKVFQPLLRAGWLRSVKGRKGGWVLETEPSNVGLREVIEVLEPGWDRCVIGNTSCTIDADLGEDSCPFHAPWARLIEEFGSVLDNTQLDGLAHFLPRCFANSSAESMSEPLTEACNSDPRAMSSATLA